MNGRAPKSYRNNPCINVISGNKYLLETKYLSSLNSNISNKFNNL